MKAQDNEDSIKANGTWEKSIYGLYLEKETSSIWTHTCRRYIENRFPGTSVYDSRETVIPCAPRRDTEMAELSMANKLLFYIYKKCLLVELLIYLRNIMS